MVYQQRDAFFAECLVELMADTIHHRPDWTFLRTCIPRVCVSVCWCVQHETRTIVNDIRSAVVTHSFALRHESTQNYTATGELNKSMEGWVACGAIFTSPRREC